MNILKAFIEDCTVRKGSRSWSCGTRPSIRPSRIPDNLIIELNGFDFRERADELHHGEINSTNINGRCRAHFHNINIEEYQGLYQKVNPSNYTEVFTTEIKSQHDFSFGRPLYQHLKKVEGKRHPQKTHLFLQYRMDVAMELSQQYGLSFTNGAWVFYNQDTDSGELYYNVALTVNQATLSPLDINKDIAVYANDPHSGKLSDWILCSNESKPNFRFTEP